MNDSNITKLPPPSGQPEFMVGPFKKWRVVIEGRVIPGLSAFHDGPDEIALVVDGRFSVSVPKALAYQVAWALANALAVGAGYPCLSSESKDRPFAPVMTKLESGEPS